LDLLKRIFIYDPNKRIKAIDALNHAWFKETQNDEGAEAARIRLENEQTLSLRQTPYWRPSILWLDIHISLISRLLGAVPSWT